VLFTNKRARDKRNLQHTYTDINVQHRHWLSRQENNNTWTYLEGVCYSNWRQLGDLNIARRASVTPQLYRRHCWCCRLAGHTRLRRSRLPRNRPQLALVDGHVQARALEYAGFGGKSHNHCRGCPMILQLGHRESECYINKKLQSCLKQAVVSIYYLMKYWFK